jgi:2-polyprenyl-6-hydroxyphenyl methylase/3-demethylubiquinone-9 3-methyltransferase
MKQNDLEFYDRSADEWWDQTSKIFALSYLNRPRFQFFDRYLPDWRDLKVLDVGCGGGFTCEFLAERGAIVVGLDQSQKCILAAQTHARTSGFEIDYQTGVAEEMPFGDRTFDVVVCVDVLEHVADLEQVIGEISRVLKPGGWFFFDTINRNLKSRMVMIWLMENLLGEIPRGVHDWRKFIQPQELTHRLQQQGFSDVEIRGFDVFGKALRLNFVPYFNYLKTGVVEVEINDDTSIMYIGKARKVGSNG